KLRAIREIPTRLYTARSFTIRTKLKGLRAPLHYLDPLASKSKELEPALDQDWLDFKAVGKCDRRGRLGKQSARVESSWPFGLFVSEAPVELEDSGITRILPAPLLPHALARSIDQHLAEAQVDAVGLPEPAAEFRSLREYRAGDSPRRIHWPTSLRERSLLVRETDPPERIPPRFAVIWHVWTPPGELVRPDGFEKILQLLAGLLNFLPDRVESTLLISGNGDATELRTTEDYRAVHDSLATVPRTALQDLDTLIGLVGELGSIDQCCILGESDSRHWREAVLAGASSHCRVTCYDGVSRSAISRTPRAKLIGTPR
ncbi:MAG: DUF58 domain-containing protein, partial [Verrucomicrobiota bacterium]